MPEDRLARALVGEQRVERLLVADLMRSLPAMLLRDGAERLRGERVAFPQNPARQLVRPVRLRRADPTEPAALRRTYARLDRLLERRAGRMGMHRPALITTNPLLAGLCELGWAGPVTYYASDDWLAHPAHRPWHAAYEESFAGMREHSRRVCSVTEAALEPIRPTGPASVIANGLDPEEWLGEPAAAPGWAERLGHPLAIYVGSLDSRLDVPALLALASARPDVTILLVGPLLDEGHLAPLRGVANIEIRPPVGRGEITSLIRAADVGLIPHVDSALTRAMSPLKLYEYLAGGVPVLASDLAPMRGVDDAVTLVAPGGDYVAGLEQALRRGRTGEAARRALIERHSWAERHRLLLDFALG